MNRLDTDLFSHPETFSTEFTAGLQRILGQHSLGAFILACANASGQAGLYQALGALLEAEYRDLRQDYLAGVEANGVAEDLQVFVRLLELGLENLPPTSTRTTGPWQLQFNAMRAFRPQRHAAQVPERLDIPFDPLDFHFNKPFMVKEQLWEGSGYGHILAAYYNKYPFADYHLLWVPDRDRQLPQFLPRQYHELIWQLCIDLNESLPGFAMGYNALGGFASVNHLHFQSYLGEPLPITYGLWQHNDGQQDYPLSVYRFHQPEEAWRLIQQMHEMNQAYNLLYTDEAMYCIPRLRQGTYEQPLWSPGFAWREVCGDMVTVEAEDFDRLTAQAIESELGKLKVVL